MIIRDKAYFWQSNRRFFRDVQVPADPNTNKIRRSSKPRRVVVIDIVGPWIRKVTSK